MDSLLFLKNKIQEYPWGSRTILPKLLGQPSPARKPQAELWMGSHPRLPSEIAVHGKSLSLHDYIASNPKNALGIAASKHFMGELPFLFKLLAVNQPLSLQAHPNKKQALLGYQREMKEKISLNAQERNFKDPNAKPEIICAVTPFWALCGFRPLHEMRTLLKMIPGKTLASVSKPLHANPSASGLKRFFTELMFLDNPRKAALILEVTGFAKKHQSLNPAFQWITKLHRLYAHDIGTIFPLLLNLIHLKEDEAIYFPPRQLHSYLQGFGVELMGNSDNVLRGGLTAKHLDIEGLIKILNFSPSHVHILKSIPVSPVEKVIPSNTEEFSLSMIQLTKGQEFKAANLRNIEMMICLDGSGRIESSPKKFQSFHRGMSWMIPASAASYRITGKAKIYKATIPLHK